MRKEPKHYLEYSFHRRSLKDVRKEWLLHEVLEQKVQRVAESCNNNYLSLFYTI